MTNVIRLNESINDYASRPVITALGEPDVAIRPSTYVTELGLNQNIDPSQLLIDGNFGQTNPAPFLGTGSGTLSLKSDEHGDYLAMNQKGIRANGFVIDNGENRGVLLVAKFRFNDAFPDATRLFSVSQGADGLGTFSVAVSWEAEIPYFSAVRADSRQTISDKVHTIAYYVSPGWSIYIIDGVKYTSINYQISKNALTSLGINTQGTSNLPGNDIDLYNFEIYLDVVLTEAQIADYLKTF